jgi:hypothetical protein
MKSLKNIAFPLIVVAAILAVVYYLYLQDQPMLENFEGSGGNIGIIIVIVVFVIVVLAVGIAIYRNPNGRFGNIMAPKSSSLGPARTSLPTGLPPAGGPPAGGKRGAKRRASY